MAKYVVVWTRDEEWEPSGYQHYECCEHKITWVKDVYGIFTSQKAAQAFIRERKDTLDILDESLTMRLLTEGNQ